MSLQFWPWPAAALRRATPWRYRRQAALTVCALLLQGCAGTPPRPLAGDDASDPAARVPAVGYRSVLGSYSTQRPVEPSAWRENNNRAAPPPKKGEQ